MRLELQIGKVFLRAGRTAACGCIGVLVLLVAAAGVRPLWGASLPTSPDRAPDQAIDRAFDRLYNSDLVSSDRLITAYTQEHPHDALGHAVRASVLLFGEMKRLQLLGDGMFSDESVKGSRPQPSKVLAKDFWTTSDRAIALAKERLLAAPDDERALLALSMACGSQRDFAAVVEKRLRDSLNYARDAQAAAVRLLKVDATAYDAYMTTGFTDYLLGSLPFFVKWVVKFEDVQATKESGLKKLEVAASKGRYLKPFAQMMLAMFYLKDKRPDDSAKLLAQLHEDFPENPSFRRELAKLQAKIPR